jgi:hypothetical protein
VDSELTTPPFAVAEAYYQERYPGLMREIPK